MATHQIGSNIELGFVDKRRNGNDPNTHVSRGVALFTANATGTTTTIVGANAAPGTDDTNIIRRGERFRLFTSAGAVKQETVFTVTTIAVAGSTTVTFTPAAATAPVSGDVARQVGVSDLTSQASMDARLLALSYSQANIDRMTENDKVYAIRLADDTGSM